MIKRVTLKDVAKKAKVSFKTVSRVINNESGVKKETSEKVKKAIQELDYIPNINAKAIRTQKSQVIGFVTDQIATTPYAVDIIKGAQDEASKHNKLLIMVNTGINDMFNKGILDMIQQRHVDGTIFAAMYHRKVELPEKVSRGASSVLVNCFSDDKNVHSIVPDEIKGGYDATSILINAGHTNIAILNLPKESIAAQLRLKGFEKALTDHQININKEFIRNAVVRTKEGEDNFSFEIAKELLQMKNAPTAIFCANDRIAMKAYDAAKDLGLSIPEDVAIIGFDNQEVIAENIYPGLSTMALPHYEMGRRAVQTISEFGKPSYSPTQELIDCDYVSRKSV